MPQADIGLVSSTVFFLFVSFLLGYFTWVNFVFPQVVVLFRVKSVVKEIKEKDFNLSGVDATSTRVDVSPKQYFSLTPAVVLDLPSDELPLLLNFVLISLSFYFILSTVLSNAHNSSREFVKSLCDFDFSSAIEESNQNRVQLIKYSRNASLISAYDILLKWLSIRSALILPLVVSVVSDTTKSVLNDVSNKSVNRKTTKLTKIFNTAKVRSNKAASLLLSNSRTKLYKIKK